MTNFSLLTCFFFFMLIGEINGESRAKKGTNTMIKKDEEMKKKDEEVKVKDEEMKKTVEELKQELKRQNEALAKAEEKIDCLDKQLNDAKAMHILSNIETYLD
mmetsp:Transcript_8519/g.9958  ORF Transcript_8519/g.9958 Transcript_8519/m.9958 type:complete len:103 (-) Transcript_8519:402-710(-)